MEQFSALFVVEPPADLPVSAKVKKLLAKHQEAVKAYRSYVAENRAKYFPVVKGLSTREPKAPAMLEAERNLIFAETQAVAEGKPLPDREEILAPVRAKVDEYARMVPALKGAAQLAKDEYCEALNAELKTIGKKVASQAAKARDKATEALKAYQEAMAELEHQADNFAFCVSQGRQGETPLRGASDGTGVLYWSLTEDGRLSHAAASALGYENSSATDYDMFTVRTEGLLEEHPDGGKVKAAREAADAEFMKTFRPTIHHAKAEGFGPNWDF